MLLNRYLTSVAEASKAFDKIAPGLYIKNTLLYMFIKDIKNLYTIGDGAGITRGLMKASASGTVLARDIAGKL